MKRYVDGFVLPVAKQRVPEYQAIAEAAQKATKFEMQGENEQAKTWRQIEAALKLMSGPHQK